jgi:hypothetical protein
MSSAWSWLLTTISVVGLWGTAGDRRWGWALNLAGQPLWLAYALLTHQLGFLVSGAAFTVIFARNLRLAHRARGQTRNAAPTVRRCGLPARTRPPLRGVSPPECGENTVDAA